MMKAPLSCYLSLATAGIGQTLLLAFAWVFLRVLWARGPVPLPYPAASFVYNNPTRTMLITTFIGTLFAWSTTQMFTLALREALRSRINSPTPLVQLIDGIKLTRREHIVNRDYLLISIFSIVLTLLALFMGSFWSTFIGPSLISWDIPVSGWELDLNSTYFESQLGAQLLSSGSASALPQDNSLEIIDNGGLMSGIAAAQQSVGISEILSFNGVSYNVSTGGVFPVVQGVGSTKLAEQTNTGLSFVGGRASGGLQPPSYRALSSAYSLLQQGLTADVRCSETPSQAVSPPQTVTIPVDIFNGSANADATYLIACAYRMTCPQGNPSQQNYVIGTTTTNDTSGNLLVSLVCPYPVRQSGLDWSKFNVTSQGNGRYQFLRSTTCEIIPKLTTSLVTYYYDNTLNVTTLTSTPLSSHNTNLSLYLASVLQYQTRNSQGMESNSIGDALYAVGAFTDIVSDNAETLSAGLILEMEQYWRGVIEFFGTYLRSGFSAYPLTIPTSGQVVVTGNYTVQSEGWSKARLIYLYSVIPITVFALFTYAAIAYALFHVFRHLRDSNEEFAALDPTDPRQLVLASLTLGKHHHPDYENMTVKACKVNNGPAPHGLMHDVALAGVPEPDVKDNTA